MTSEGGEAPERSPLKHRDGRPKGSKNRRTMVRDVAQEVHSIPKDGKTVRRTTVELVAMVVRDQAASGNANAIRDLEKLYQMFGRPSEPVASGGLTLPYPKPLDVWAKELIEYTELTKRRALENKSDTDP